MDIRDIINDSYQISKSSHAHPCQQTTTLMSESQNILKATTKNEREKQNCKWIVEEKCDIPEQVRSKPTSFDWAISQ